MATGSEHRQKIRGKFKFLTTRELREEREAVQKYRNIIALGLFAMANAIIVNFIITHFNLSYLHGYLVDLEHTITNETADTIFSFSVAAGSIAYLITVIIGGAFSDDYRSKYGARAPYILSGCLIAGFMLIMTPIFAGGAPGELMVVLFPVCFFLIYVGLGLASSPYGALLSELFTKEQRGWVGLILAGFTTLGSMIGLLFFSPISNFLLELATLFSLSILIEVGFFLFPALIITVVGILIFFLVEKANPPFPPIDSPVTDILQTPNYLLNISGSDFGKMFFVQSFWGFSSEIIAIYLVIHLTTPMGILPEEVPAVLMVTGIVSVIMAIPAGFFIQKFGKVRTAIVGSIIYAFFALLMSGMEIGDYYGFLIPIAALGGLGAVFIESVRVSLPADLVPEGKEAQFMGINKFGSTWTQPIVSILGGMIISTFSSWEYSATAILFLLATISSFIATGLLFLISYEKMMKEEYQKFYHRYLATKGFFEKKIDSFVDSIL